MHHRQRLRRQRLQPRLLLADLADAPVRPQRHKQRHNHLQAHIRPVPAQNHDGRRRIPNALHLSPVRARLGRLRPQRVPHPHLRPGGVQLIRTQRHHVRPLLRDLRFHIQRQLHHLHLPDQLRTHPRIPRARGDGLHQPPLHHPQLRQQRLRPARELTILSSTATPACQYPPTASS